MTGTGQTPSEANGQPLASAYTRFFDFVERSLRTDDLAPVLPNAFDDLEFHVVSFERPNEKSVRVEVDALTLAMDYSKMGFEIKTPEVFPKSSVDAGDFYRVMAAIDAGPEEMDWIKKIGEWKTVICYQNKRDATLLTNAAAEKVRLKDLLDQCWEKTLGITFISADKGIYPIDTFSVSLLAGVENVRHAIVMPTDGEPSLGPTTYTPQEVEMFTAMLAELDCVVPESIEFVTSDSPPGSGNMFDAVIFRTHAGIPQEVWQPQVDAVVLTIAAVTNRVCLRLHERDDHEPPFAPEQGR